MRVLIALALVIIMTGCSNNRSSVYDPYGNNYYSYDSNQRISRRNSYNNTNNYNNVRYSNYSRQNFHLHSSRYNSFNHGFGHGRRGFRHSGFGRGY